MQRLLDEPDVQNADNVGLANPVPGNADPNNPMPGNANPLNLGDDVQQNGQRARAVGPLIENMVIFLQQQQKDEQQQLQRHLLQAILARRPRTAEEFMALLRTFVQRQQKKTGRKLKFRLYIHVMLKLKQKINIMQMSPVSYLASY